MSNCRLPDDTRDRRHTRRHRAGHGIVSARVRPGCEVSLLDVSAGGALVETSCRLLPGSSIELHLATLDRKALVRGDVLRSAVVQVRAAGICYHAAIGFDRHLSWFVDEEVGGYQLHSGEARLQRLRGADVTRETV